MPNEKSLGVVCCYFNPYNYKSKKDNFLVFFKKTSRQVNNLLVVELIYKNQKHSLPSEINSLKVYSDQILWHKENLLNIGISKLIYQGYENIAWLDADVIFNNSHWPGETVEKLQRSNLCQLFSTSRQYINKDDSVYRDGCVKYWKISGSTQSINTVYKTGYAWASKSSILQSCKLYDKAILGGGDSLLWNASFSKGFNLYGIMQNHPILKLRLPSYFQDYFNWSKEWGELIKGKVDCNDDTISSLHHGRIKNRKYIKRYELLKKHDYCPIGDTYYDESILKCNNKKLTNDINKYFFYRNEDDKLFRFKF